MTALPTEHANREFFQNVVHRDMNIIVEKNDGRNPALVKHNNSTGQVQMYHCQRGGRPQRVGRRVGKS